MDERQKKLERIKILEHRKKLPHLYGYPWYSWAKEFFENTTDRMQLLTAANQVSKSSTMIRKCIHWATEKKVWGKAWATEPRQFWYLYPNSDFATSEVETKWIPEFLPKDKDDPVYGWDLVYKPNKKVDHLVFKSGVRVYFKTYEQDVHALQGSSVHALFCFASDTKVSIVGKGLVDIKDVRKGDYVSTCVGNSCVVKIPSRGAQTILRVFSNGDIIRATPDHYFMTKEHRWVKFAELEEDQRLLFRENWVDQRRFIIKDTHIPDIQMPQTGDSTTFKITLSTDQRGTYTGQFGWNTLVKYLKDTSYTIKTKIQRITALVTWSLLQKQSIQEDISLRNGLVGGLELLRRGDVRCATKNLTRVLLRREFHVLARRNVEGGLILLSTLAKIVAKSFWRGVMTRNELSVLRGAYLEKSEKVYCLKTEVGHFQVCGITVKNCDEELPENLYSELYFRTAATHGYYHGAFTATRAQEFWREAMEEIGTPIERFKGAWKRQVSLFDCMTYADGSPSPWSKDRIQEVIESCKDENEVLRRVYGRFVRSDGRRYVFTKEKNYKAVELPIRVPQDWILFGSVDWGSGQEKRGKSAIVFTAVSPDFKQGRAVYAWRGDGVSTTAGDLFDKYMEIKQKFGFKPMIQIYDHAAIDFGVIATRAGESFIKADKSRDKGDELMNTLFRRGKLFVDNNGEIGNERLATELASLGVDSIHGDDLADAFRYGVTFIPWNMEDLAPDNFVKKTKTLMEKGRDSVPQVHTIEDDFLSELNEWSAMYE